MQILNLKWKFLNYPSLNFGFSSYYDQFIPFREFPNCCNPLRIEIDINLILTPVRKVIRSAVLRSKNAHFHLDLFYTIRLFEFPALIKPGFN